MEKKYIVLTMLLLLFSFAQGQTVESKKCKTCGKPLKECEFSGRHTPNREKKQDAVGKTGEVTNRSNIHMDGNEIVFMCEGTEYRYKMVYVKGGSFSMGCPTECEDNIYEDAIPVHTVTLNDYFIGETEVTQALWKAVMGSEPKYNGEDGWTEKRGRGINYPAYFVNYNECKTFLKKLSKITGRTFRFPTEAEWEYAARGGNYGKGYKYSGSDNVDVVAWHANNSGYNGVYGSDCLHPVKQKQSNEIGLYDMSGNVYEWCSDWYGSYSNGPQIDPKGPGSGRERVVRGGAYPYNPLYCAVFSRHNVVPEWSNIDYGFRIVMIY